MPHGRLRGGLGGDGWGTYQRRRHSAPSGDEGCLSPIFSTIAFYLKLIILVVVLSALVLLYRIVTEGYHTVFP